jgi:hypothetical protein
MYLKKYILIMGHLGIIVMMLFLNGCESEKLIDQTPDAPDQVIGFPDFITPTGKYFDPRTDGIPPIGAESSRSNFLEQFSIGYRTYGRRHCQGNLTLLLLNYFFGGYTFRRPDSNYIYAFLQG